MFNKILLIDDDEITLMLCEFVLEDRQIAKEIVKLNNGHEGIAYFENLKKNKLLGSNESTPALIFLDLNMPIMNGWDLLDDLLALYPRLSELTKVILLSSTVDPQDLARAANYEIVFDFINKPLDEDAVTALMQNPKLQEFHKFRQMP